jgi:hypothetical protein
MAEETLLLKLQLQADSTNAKTINDLIKDQKKLAKLIKDAPKEGTKEYKKFEATLKKAKAQYAANSDEIKRFNKELKTGDKQFKNAGDSLKGLSTNLRRLENEYKSLGKEQRKTSEARKLRRNIIRTRKELSKAERGLGDFRRSVGNYTKSLVGLNAGIGSVFVSVGTLKTALGGLVGAFRSAGGAAKAFLLTLGPIVIALGLITAALSKFQSITDSIGNTLAGAGAVFDVFAERFGRFGLAFEKLLTLDFSGFAEDIKNSFAGIGEEIRNDFNEASALSNALNELRDREINSIVTLAQLRLDAASARRKSAELEKTDRAAAARAIQEAIDLTQQIGDIESGIAREREEIMRRQVELSAETTSADDRRELAEQSAKVLNLEAAIELKVAKLIKRRDELNRSAEAANKKQINALQELQNEQSKLTEIIKLQLLAGEDATKNLERFAEVTAKLLDVETEFKMLTESLSESIESQQDSIKDYNDRLSQLNEELSLLTVGSQEYLQYQEEIAKVEAERAVATGELTMSINELNAAQEENIRILEESETALRLRAQAFSDIQALEGTAEEVARKRLEIESKLNQDLRQIRENSINDRKDDLDQELAAIDSNLEEELRLFADNEVKKQEILLIAQGKRDEIKKKQLELDAELLKIGVKNFSESEKKKTDSEKAEQAKRKQLRDIAIDTAVQAAGQITELLSVLQEQQTEKEFNEIEKREKAELEEAERLGKTEEEKLKIRERFEREREELEKRAAAERKALALAEAAIDIAGAVIKSLNSPAPANVALAASTAALGAIQLAIIAATNFAGGGLVQPVQLEDGRIVNTPNIRQMSNGDNILATVRTGEVILNERQQESIGGAAALRAAGVPGFARGGKVDLEPIAKASPYAKGGMTPRFTSSFIKAKAYQSGGVFAANAAQQISGAIEKENKTLLDGIESAVAKGSALGSKQGIESADIGNQLSREQERKARRNENESF